MTIVVVVLYWRAEYISMFILLLHYNKFAYDLDQFSSTDMVKRPCSIFGQQRVGIVHFIRYTSLVCRIFGVVFIIPCSCSAWCFACSFVFLSNPSFFWQPIIIYIIQDTLTCLRCDVFVMAYDTMFNESMHICQQDFPYWIALILIRSFRSRNQFCGPVSRHPVPFRNLKESISSTAIKLIQHSIVALTYP